VIKITVTVTDDKDEVRYTDFVSITDAEWPLPIKLWRQACNLAHLLLWESHPTYQQRNKESRDYSAMLMDKYPDNGWSDEEHDKLVALIAETSMFDVEKMKEQGNGQTR